jgi:hypothetical protein
MVNGMDITPVSDIDRIEYIGNQDRITDLSSATPIARPDTATHIWIQPLTQNIRVIVNEATQPAAAVGFQIAAGTIKEIPVKAGSLRVIEETSGATVEYQWIRRR